jgi:hypothetical protein
MSKSSLDGFGIALLILVVALAVIDFLMGKPGRQKLQSILESWWLKLSYIRLPTLGLSEAQSFVEFIDRVFGRRLLSRHRLVSTAVLVTILVSIAYLILETSQVTSGPPRWPFAAEYMRWPFQVILAMVSISITRALVTTCLRAVKGYRWGTPIFLFAIGLAGYLSAAIVTTMAMSLFPLESLITGYFAEALRLVTHSDVAKFYQPPSTTQFFLPLLSWMAMTGVRVSRPALYDPVGAWDFFINFALDLNMVGPWYDFFIALGVGAIRILFAVVFLASWMFLPPLKWISSLILLRLAEAERGALTVIAAGGAVLAKLIQELIKSMSG